MNIVLVFHEGCEDFKGDYTVCLPEGAIVADALNKVGYPSDEDAIVSYEGIRVPYTEPLKDGQKLVVFPSIIGG